MDKKSLTILILSMTAGIMIGANFFSMPTAQGLVAVKDRDYQLISARSQSSGDAIYVIDNRTSQMCVFAWNPSTRRMEPRAVRNIADAFKE